MADRRKRRDDRVRIRPYESTDQKWFLTEAFRSYRGLVVFLISALASSFLSLQIDRRIFLPAQLIEAQKRISVLEKQFDTAEQTRRGLQGKTDTQQQQINTLKDKLAECQAGLNSSAPKSTGDGQPPGSKKPKKKKKPRPLQTNSQTDTHALKLLDRSARLS